MFPELPKDETLLELYESRIIQTYCVKGNALTPDRLFAFPTSIYISEGVSAFAKLVSRTLSNAIVHWTCCAHRRTGEITCM